MSNEKKGRGERKAAAGFAARDFKLPFQGTDAIEPHLLETFPYQYPGRPIQILTETEEFTSVCPFSGLPDFGRLRIEYEPDKACVELRSLKYYLLSYRNVGIFYEHLANRIVEDLVRAIRPRRLEVVCDMTVRGGLRTTIRAQYQKGRGGRPKAGGK